MTQTVLVLGGAGYIGSHACKYLSERGFKVVVYDNLSRGNRDVVKYGPLVEGDINDSKTLTATLILYNPIAVMHFAALAYVGESVSNPLEYYHNNVSGTLSILKCMKDSGVKNIIFSSSCATYGNRDEPISESDPQNPVNPYGSSKLMSESMIKDFGNAYGIRYVILRYFNAAGADPSGEVGELHNPETHLIPLAIEAALGLSALTVNGFDHATQDGTCVRDYVHVWDLAQAHYLSLKHLLDGKPSDEFNLGSGKGYSIREVTDEVTLRAMQPMLIKYADKRPGDPPILVSKSDKARLILGWNPEYSSLKEIVKTAWNWRCRHKTPSI